MTMGLNLPIRLALLRVYCSNCCIINESDYNSGELSLGLELRVLLLNLKVALVGLMACELAFSENFSDLFDGQSLLLEELVG